LIRDSDDTEEKEEAVFPTGSIDDEQPKYEVCDQEEQAEIEFFDLPVAGPQDKPGSGAVGYQDQDYRQVSGPGEGRCGQKIVEQNINAENQGAIKAE
jgi:hypothetical protein